MKESVTIGSNKTGIKSPLPSPDKGKMVDNQDDPFKAFAHAPEDFHPEQTRKEIQQEYVRSSGAIGSIPPPPTMKGMATTGFQKIMGRNPEVLVDKLGERLAFERTGTRLYDALINKCEVALPNISLDVLYEIRNDEERHFHMLHDVIKTLGADPSAMTPCADVAAVEAKGLVSVINDPRMNVAQSAHAILVAELADNDGWDLLIKLVDQAGLDKVVEQFREAKRAEERHLVEIRQWVEKLSMQNATVPLH